MLPWILLIIMTALFVAAAFVAYRFAKRAIGCDTVIQYLYDDIETNLTHFQQMRTSAILSEEPEVKEAHHKMMIMGQRLNEILLRMEDETGLRLRPPPRPPPPKVV